MNPRDPHADPEGRSLTRGEVERVIRRAIELSSAESDDERLSADEVVRIGAELGLPAHHIRLAMYELPADARPENTFVSRWVERRFGPATWVAFRPVTDEPERALEALGQYLVTRESLLLRRRHAGGAWLEPADDAFSVFSRAIGGLSRRYRLVNARGVAIAAQPLEPGRTHVQIALDFAPRRRSALRAGILVGGGAGAAVGAGAFMLLAAAVAPAAGIALGVLAGAGAALAAIGGGIAAGIAQTATRFRRLASDARLEIDALLDRLERGELLPPPQPPLLRRIGGHLFGPAPGRGRSGHGDAPPTGGT